MSSCPNPQKAHQCSELLQESSEKLQWILSNCRLSVIPVISERDQDCKMCFHIITWWKARVKDRGKWFSSLFQRLEEAWKNQRWALASAWSCLVCYIWEHNMVLSTAENAEFLSLGCLQPNCHIGKLEDFPMDYIMKNYFSTKRLERPNYNFKAVCSKNAFSILTSEATEIYGKRLLTF